MPITTKIWLPSTAIVAFGEHTERTLLPGHDGRSGPARPAR
jgi:hypothetical protein